MDVSSQVWPVRVGLQLEHSARDWAQLAAARASEPARKRCNRNANTRPFVEWVPSALHVGRQSKLRYLLAQQAAHRAEETKLADRFGVGRVPVVEPEHDR